MKTDSSEKVKEIKSQIKALEQKKATLTDTIEIKSINKKINELQVKFGRLREGVKDERAFLKDIEREFIHIEIGDD